VVTSGGASRPIVALFGIVVIILLVVFIARYLKLPRLETLSFAGLFALGLFESAFFVLSLPRVFDRPLYFLVACILILVTAIIARDVFNLSESGALAITYGAVGGSSSSLWVLTRRRSRY